MLKFDRPVWRIAAESFFAAAVVSAFFIGLQWALERSGAGETGNLVPAVMGGFYLVVLLPVFYYLFKQQSMVRNVRRELEKEQLLDETTRLYKARVFKEMAGTQIRLCKRNGWHVGIVLMDIDRLGAINEKYGYDAGNRVLRHFAEVVKESIRESDTVARLDDDRFALLLPNCDAKDARRVVRRIQEQILSEPLKLDRATVKIPFSSGVSSFAGKVAKYNLLLKRATEALETAKRKGGNRIELF
ncbi:GGDEF domain-containing protein [Hydrogenimonas sp. SS33]|uniref:GGDEF domain-containing protein n=1 Tax=Hydrogenimonas leucolamina TaxID=2954236 RepID=UPI00336C14CD